jgi:mannose-6-phosphate isomerase-like protein (cupin superfamily)
MKKGFFIDLEQETLANSCFRRVAFTGEHLQLVLMSLEAGEDIGLETHNEHDQFIRVEEGVGEAFIAGESFALSDGSAVVIPAGAEHNIKNTGDTPLKLYTLYAPPEHQDGVVHRTKDEALLYEEHHAHE